MNEKARRQREMHFQVTARSVLHRMNSPLLAEQVFFALSDSSGHIRSISSQSNLFPIPELQRKGACWIGDKLSPNGLSLALQNQKTTVVFGKDHILPELADWFTLAVPFPFEEDSLLGAFFVAGPVDKYSEEIIDWINQIAEKTRLRLQSDQKARHMAQSMLLAENMRLVAAAGENTNTNLGVAIIDHHKRIIDVNAKGRKLLKRARGDLLGENPTPFILQLLQLSTECLEAQEARYQELSASAEASRSPVFVNCQPLKNEADDSILGTLLVFHDFEQAVYNSPATQQALTHLEDDVVVLDKDGRIVFGNRFESHHIGRPYIDVVFQGEKFRPDGEHNSLLLQALETQQDTISKVYQTPDGTRIRRTDIRLLKDHNNQVVGVVGIRKDITEEQLLKNQLVHSERLSTIGELAAQTIHELRNPLAAIRASAQLALVLDDEEKDTTLNQIIQEIDKVNDFVSNILLLAKPANAFFQAENLGDILNSVLDLIKAKMVFNNVSIVRNYAKATLAPVKANAKLLEQALLNVLNNALDAMKDNGGILTLTITERADRNCQELTIADTGLGIAASDLDNLFKPFFTTKGDSGTGLGLAITKRIIVESHEGQIWIESEPGRGTIVHIELSLVDRNM